MTTDPSEAFERWLRGPFVETNTALDEAYFAEGRELVRAPDLDDRVRTLAHRGAELIAAIADRDRVEADPMARYQLLGAVGFYLAACRRHDADAVVDDPHAVLAPAWALARRLGSSLGVAPRYVFAHQSTHNPAVDGVYRRFTSLPDEERFVSLNALAVLAYRRAAGALSGVVPMGVSNPLSGYLLDQARIALDDVLRFEQDLSRTVDPRRFFLDVRPYFMSHRVGGTVYRGVNAGDFSAVNEVDLLLGLCRASDPFYQGFLTEKHPYVPPEDQIRLERAVQARPLLDRLLDEAGEGPVAYELRANAAAYLEVCRAHAAAASFHHHRLVLPFLAEPARSMSPDEIADVTASGPPLEVVIAGLERLTRLRTAQDRPGAPTMRARLDRVRVLAG